MCRTGLGDDSGARLSVARTNVRGMATGPDAPPQHDVLRGLAGAAESLDLVVGANDWSLSDEEVRASLAEAARVKARAHGAYLRLLAASARRDDPTRSGVKGGAETAAWLSAECRMSASRVRGDLREAQVLDPDGELRALGAELRAGNVTPEHTRIAVRALAGVPATMMRERRDDIDEILTDHATTFAPPVTRDLARQLLVTLDPDRADHFDTEAHLRRELRMGTDSTGMWDVRGRLDPACGAAFKAAIDHLGAPHRGPVQGEAGQAEIDITDRRTPAQRNHDALAELVRLANGNLDAGVRAGEGPRVVVHTTPEQLAAAAGAGASAFLKAPPGAAACEQSGPLAPATLARLACDAVIERVLLSEGGAVLKLETLGRFFTAAQRRALAARDGGCAWPSCDRPPSWTDAHHVTFWMHGGPTTVDNGVLLCEPHHTEVHFGEWTIVMRDGIPWIIPPARIDPLQRPVRNTVHDAIAATRKAGQQLYLNLPLRHRPERT